ncbi:uncharacterized protein LOC109831044 [Asparagus officinalis]|uniref:uncharacterized protein LOC109831044 n=1 Tax=Asparagus officinalis TaxID=4686 RepID=UPI00098E0883|nr:uncharacterized protein LOC109831044 [Asparagus officinalis]
MLHEGNYLPRSTSQAKKIIDDLGLTYEKIDACPNDCMLFWKETANLTVCSTCGPNAPGNDIDVYLKPLMDELKELWEVGANTYDVFSNQFRNDGPSFDGKCERGRAPKMLTRTQCIAQMSNLTFTFGKSPPSESETDDITRKKKRKRNTSAASKEQRNERIRKILYTLLGTSKRTKDGLEARADLELLNIRKGLHPIRVGARTYLPPAIFSMTNEEKTLFCRVLSKVRFHDGYSSNVARSVDVKDQKIHGLKSHDHHVIMHQLLPLAIRRVLPRPLTLVLLELSAIFRRLCGKKESEASFKHLEYRIALIVCYLEKMLPPSFFDIKVHLLVHLAHKAAIAGPVQYRWMYPIERYLQTLKRYVRNKNYPEGSICIGYLADEALAFCSMYLSDIETRRTRRGHNADVSTPREGLSIFAYSGRCVGKATQVDLERSAWEQCRKYILFNCSEVSPFLEKRMAELRKIYRRKTVREVENLRNKEFPTWFQNHVNDLHAKGDSSVTKDIRRLANGPNMTVKQYKTCIVNGCRFRIKSVDDNHKNQNCGVSISAQTLSYSSVRDNNPITGNVDYYGVLKNIYECDYGLPGEPEGHGKWCYLIVIGSAILGRSLIIMVSP